jgi:glutamate/tyrosine decarboxylase-like PLP-dependent enzyme
MGAGIYITRHPEILSRTCAMNADYMPRDAAGLEIVDPYGHSMQWSRRFIGLKVFLSLAAAGWNGYAQAILHQANMGNLLRARLAEAQWRIVNRTPFPLVNFVDAADRPDEYMQQVVQRVLASGKAWISTVRLPIRPSYAGRACITNYRTQPEDLDALVAALHAAR